MQAILSKISVVFWHRVCLCSSVWLVMHSEALPINKKMEQLVILSSIRDH